MNKTLIFLSIFSLFYIQTNAQKKLKIKEEQIVEANDLKAKFPDDDLAINYYENHVTFGFDNSNNLVTVKNDVQYSILNIGTRADIPIYEFYDGKSEITKLTATRSNRKNNFFLNVNDHAYSSNGIFHNDVRVKLFSIDFPMFGSKYNIEITKEFKDIKYFTTLPFSDQYPVANRKIVIEVPSWLSIEFKEVNFGDYGIEKTVTEEGDNTIYTFIAKNLPSQYKESRMPGFSYVYPHLLVLAKSHTKKGTKEQLFESTADQYAWYKSLTEELANNHADFKDKVAELTKDAQNDEEKIKNIFYWVQDNIRYIAFEDGIAGFKPDEAANVYNNRYGDCKGMANLTKNMLTEAGYDARLCWIGTNHIAYDYSTPNLAVDNHMICAVNLNGKFIFLDGTEDYNAFGEYANRIQNRQVLIENGDSYILERIPVTNSIQNQVTTNMELALEGETLKGKVHRVMKGESRTSLLQFYHTLENTDKEDFLKSYLSYQDNDNVKVINPTTSDFTDRDAEITMDYDVTLQNYTMAYGNEMYIGLEFANPYESMDFSERKTDYCFYYKKEIDDAVVFTIPEGYKATYLPSDLTVDTPEFSASLTYKQEGNTIFYNKKFNFKKDKITKDHFTEWNDFHKKLTTFYQEQITLTKI